MISFNTQPKVIQNFIFSFLPEEDRRICRLVCKQWKENIKTLLNPTFHSTVIILNKLPAIKDMKNNHEGFKSISNLKKIINTILSYIEGQKKQIGSLLKINSFKSDFHKYFEGYCVEKFNNLQTNRYKDINDSINEIETIVSKSVFRGSHLGDYVQELKKALLIFKNDILNQVDEIDRILKEQNLKNKNLPVEHLNQMHLLIDEYYEKTYRLGIVYQIIYKLNLAIDSTIKQLKKESELLDQKCLKIDTIDLNGLDIDVFPEDILKSAIQLNHLEINQNKMEKFYMKSGTLRYLTIADNLLNNVNLRRLEGLTELNLSGNKIKNIDLSANWQLVHLNISRNPIQISNLNLLKNKMLKTLNLSDNLNDDKSKSSLNLINNERIEKLILEKCSNVEFTISKIVRSQFKYEIDGHSNNISCIYADDEEEVVTDEEDPFAPLNDD